MQKSEKGTLRKGSYSSPENNCVAINFFSKMMIEQLPQMAFNLLKEVTIDTGPVGKGIQNEKEM